MQGKLKKNEKAIKREEETKKYWPTQHIPERIFPALLWQ